ncbi:MAG: Cys-Xaa-Xaa-Xaa repeat radical SAM target protein [Prevotella sp.]|nr:Cys-Xaa-Xaa-Xaa repeat radical SAM target protein [Prevotella sp.]
MEKKMKNEELQNRREFFKNAAKGALPILGAIVLAGVPNVVKAAEDAPMGCTGTCYTGCKNGCRGCSTTCTGGCSHYACKGIGKN